MLVIAGISGDLSRRKLLPALKNLEREGQMPFGSVIGTTRRDVAIAGVDVRRMDIGGVEDCKALARDIGTARHVFYLSVPPGAAPAIAEALATAGFGGSTLVLEKPFGFSAASASAEAARVATFFSDQNVLRVDHYLCKKIAGEIAGQGRGAREVKIFASEDSDVSQRADFYEKTGALRDFGNHLLTLAAVTLGGLSSIERLEALKDMEIVESKRGQYEGYEGAAETFFELVLQSGSTKLVLASGKALKEKSLLVDIDGKQFSDGPDRAYEEVLLAAADREGKKFLTLSEVMESWRIMDAAREHWGEMRHYPRLSALEALVR